MELAAAFLLGLFGSLHCAGMCGPLALALPATGDSSVSFIAGRIAYNLGRIITYSVLGLVFGALGMSFALAGWQQWVSLILGILVLLSVFASSRLTVNGMVIKGVNWVKRHFSRLLQRRTFGSVVLLGLLNGLLPCGLVYAACTGAVATGGVLSGTTFMVAFGLGTLPMMLAIGLFGKRLQLVLRFRLQRLIPFCVLTLGVLLVLRGLGLGIPYLSPAISATGAACCAH